MFNPIQSLSLGCAEIPQEMVRSAIDALISKMAPLYLELMSQAQKTPEIISNNHLNLRHYYEYMNFPSEVTEAINQTFARRVVTKRINFLHRNFSVFSEKNGGFGETIDKARFYSRLIVDVQNLNKKNPLDRLLSELRKKIRLKERGALPEFDVRLEKGCLQLESNPWQWHYDIGFKTSVTVCYSNKKNWSTRIADTVEKTNERPAAHGFLYNTLKVFHRAPVPTDFNGEELQVDDYRLFIRYNEFAEALVYPKRKSIFSFFASL